jgi:hypothetical protein
MNKEEPLIVWEKWIDPFGQALEEAKWTDYENEIDTLDNIEYVDEEEIEMKSIKAIATPMGIIPYNELTAPASLFNFWVGHTNFNITKPIVQIIEDTPGVEILDVFTRYRFRIGIGKCFADNETMKEVNDRIYNQLYSKNDNKK